MGLPITMPAFFDAGELPSFFRWRNGNGGLRTGKISFGAMSHPAPLPRLESEHAR